MEDVCRDPNDSDYLLVFGVSDEAKNDSSLKREVVRGEQATDRLRCLRRGHTRRS